jgi:cytoskeletal protein RodZ
VELEDIARATRIPVSYLRAIEQGEFDKMPGGFYRISFIRQYARVLGIDESELLQGVGDPSSSTAEPNTALVRSRPASLPELAWRGFLKQTKRALNRLVTALSA